MGLLDLLADVAVAGLVGFTMLNDNSRNSMIRDAERRGNEWENEARKRGYSSERISAARERYDDNVARMREASDRVGEFKDSWKDLYKKR